MFFLSFYHFSHYSHSHHTQCTILSLLLLITIYHTSHHRCDTRHILSQFSKHPGQRTTLHSQQTTFSSQQTTIPSQRTTYSPNTTLFYTLLTSHSYPMPAGQLKYKGWKKLIKEYLVFVTGRGGVCFHSPDPGLTRGRGGYVSGNPDPAPLRGPPALIP